MKIELEKLLLALQTERRNIISEERLLINGFPRQQIGRQVTPWRTRPNHPAQGVEDIAQTVLALQRDERPFFNTHVTQITCSAHFSNYHIQKFILALAKTRVSRFARLAH